MGQLTPNAEGTARITIARQRFFEGGEDPGGALAPALLRSWRRCREAGLDPQYKELGDPEGRSQLAVARERSQLLLDNASGVMEHLFEQIRASGSMVILADDQGMILHSLGDPEFISRAQRVALQPGARWSESARGTNAIGTALAEASAIEVIGSEHFIERNGVLSCSAVPVLCPSGRIAGVLDISGDSRSDQRHTLGLVKIATQLLEKRLFELTYRRELLVAIHQRPECIGGMQEGLLAINAACQLLGANASARNILKNLTPRFEQTEFSTLFRLAFGSFIDHCRRDPHALQAVDSRQGERLFARLHNSALLAVSPAGAASTSRPASNTSRSRTTDHPCNRRAGFITLDCLATGDPRLQLALDRAARISGKDIPLLVHGESGVGKDLFARAFHYSGPRREGPFIALNCAAIPENLIESELFGYVGGAFTGARREGATGKIQQADGGTLFLDEIGDMPLGMQARLLRVLQERCVTPIGGQRQIPVNISLVCATHRVLKEAVKAGSFREDLYYRVNGLAISIPPLRERSDICSIADKILQDELADSTRSTSARISPEVLDFIQRYPWPGNIRQLQNVLRVATALLDDDEEEILPCHLPEELFSIDPMDDAECGRPSTPLDPGPAALATTATSPAAGKVRSLNDIELEAISVVLAEVGGNVSAAARRLGISRNTLYRKMGRL